MRGTACRNRQDGYVSLPCQVWHSLSGANPHLLPRITHERALSETRHYPGSAQVDLKRAPPADVDFVTRMHSGPETSDSAAAHWNSSSCSLDSAGGHNEPRYTGVCVPKYL